VGTTGPSTIEEKAMSLNHLKFLLLIGICLLAGIYAKRNLEHLDTPPWVPALRLQYPQYAVADQSENLYVIDDSERRVVRIDAQDKISLVLNGGLREPGSFFYAKSVEVDNRGNIYVLNNTFDDKGYYLQREEILQYSPQGDLIKTVYQREFKPDEVTATTAQRGQIKGLKFFDGKLVWFVVDSKGITPESFQTDMPSQPAQKGRSYVLEAADLKLGNIHTTYDGGFLYTLNDGTFHKVVLMPDGQYYATTVFAAPQDNFTLVPWSIGVSKDKEIYFIDLISRSIQRLEEAGPTKVFDRDFLIDRSHDVDEFNYYRFSISDNENLITTNDEAVLQVKPGSNAVRYISDLSYDSLLTLVHLKVWLGAAVFCLAFTVLVILALRWLLGQFSMVIYQSISIIIAVIVSSIIASNIILKSLTQKYDDAILGNTSQTLQLASRAIDGDLFSSITGMSSFNSDEYWALREDFMKSVNYNRDEWNKNTYFSVYRVVDGRLFGFMYLNGAIGMLHPFDWLGDNSVYDRALSGEISTDKTVDVSGEWIYGVAPIRNSSGDVVALYEVGADLYAHRLANKKLIEGIIWHVVTILVIMVFVMIEVTFLYQLLKDRSFLSNRGSDEAWGSYSDVQMARPMVFLFFVAVSISVAFIPVMMKQFYQPVSWMSQEMLLALPISLETFFFGMATTGSVYFIARLGWRLTFIGGLLVMFSGLIFSGLAWDMVSFCVARAISGLGSGVGYIALRAFINQEQREIEKSGGFSHFYAGMTAGASVGVVLGASIADTYGFSTVFYVGAGVLLLCAALYQSCLRKTPFVVVSTGSPSVGKSSVAPWRSFLVDPTMWVFVILLTIPCYVAGTFLTYHLPLFAEEQGLSTADVGRLFILNGLFVIYLGPSLTRWLKDRFGDYNAMMIGSWMWAAGLMVFALTGSIWGAIFAVVIMGIVEGFNAAVHNDFFLRMPSARRLSEDTATGVFELIGKLGETVGPIIFSAVLLLGVKTGLLLLGVFIIVATFPAMFFLRRNLVMEKTAS
jgi:predicted MFS family arabinose efflux permease